MVDAQDIVHKLKGPILVLGAGGFVGANLMHYLLRYRDDVYGSVHHEHLERVAEVNRNQLFTGDLLNSESLHTLLDKVRPKTVFNCVAYGAYSFQKDSAKIYATNFMLTEQLLRKLTLQNVDAYVHAGSSSEYGECCAAPLEDAQLTPNSDYAVSKAACASLIYYYGKHKGLRCANLRLYAVYGPYEDNSRLIPTLVRKAIGGELPVFVNPEVSRDFIYVDDVCRAFVHAALYLPPQHFGESFNIGTGRKTTIREVASIAQQIFGITTRPDFTMPARHWDCVEWYANPRKASEVLNFKPLVTFEDGLRYTRQWMESAGLPPLSPQVSGKSTASDEKASVSVIIACYKDEQAIPIMHERLTRVFDQLRTEYEIIFVNDCSPYDDEAVIQRLSAQDSHVIGISHSRNFGSQAAFRSGMEIATKRACVLMDGDLQDPPELIPAFVEKWRTGYDVVYGRRIRREESWHMQIGYKLFYRLFKKLSHIPIPLDAGDFSLIDRRVVNILLRFSERDLLMRGIRAYAGFKQAGIDYTRPKRMFGHSTNNWFSYLGWAKKGILSFSYVPLNVLSALGVLLLIATTCLGVYQVLYKLLYPTATPQGVTTLLLVISFSGALNLFAISIIGEYIGKIMEEVKQRPHFIRRSIIRDGIVSEYE